MVLAAGRGERMRPLSDVVPKPALPMPGRPLVGWALGSACGAGARRVVVNTWHLAARMEQALRACEWGGDAVVSHEERLMGTGGGLALARDRGLLAGTAPVLVINGDCVLELDLEPLVRRHLGSRDLVTLALLPHPDPGRWSQVLLTPSGGVERFVAVGGSSAGREPFLYCGAMLVSRTALEAIPKAVGGVAEMLWQAALAAGRLGGTVVRGRWLEVGSPAAYLDAVQELLGGASTVAEQAEVATDAEVDSSLVGAGAQIRGQASVRRSVVAEGAVVGRNARVLRSVLMGTVEVAEGEFVRDEFMAR